MSEFEPALPQPRVDVLEARRARRAATTPSCSRTRCSRPTSPPARGRGSTRASTGTSSICNSATACWSAFVPRCPTPCTSTSAGAPSRAIALFRPGSFEAVETGGQARVEAVAAELRAHSNRRRRDGPGAPLGRRPVDRGCRGRRRGRARARIGRGVLARRRPCVGRRRGGRRDAGRRLQGLAPALLADRPDRHDGVAEAVHRARHLRRGAAQGRDAELEGDRRDQQGSERADLRVQRPRRGRRRAAIVPCLVELLRARKA